MSDRGARPLGPAEAWRCGDRTFELDGRPLVMGIVNVTPDSFSDGGRFLDAAAAIAHGRRLAAEGADLVDLGAESTRPGSAPVTADEQIRRLLPVVEALAGDPAITISVDTADAEVAAWAVAAGAHVVNDVSGLEDPRMAETLARTSTGVVVMHRQGVPATMQADPRYDDVAREVSEHLAARVAAGTAAGIAAERIAIDPGIGFGKTARHNAELLARLDEIAALGRPVLVDVSRKSFLGRALDLPVDQRLEAGLAATAVAVFQGAAIVRTHDVAATRRAVALAAELRAARRDAS